MKIITKRKWLLTITVFVTVAVGICNLLTYIVDPFFQYRVKDNQYMTNPQYSACGLIKNHDYDTIILGSSMTQNFDMDLFRTELNCAPLNIGIGGMADEDLAKYTLFANEIGKAENYYICIDISHFRIKQGSEIIDYLMNDDLLSRLKYAMSYESIFRFMPVDIVFTACIKAGISLPESYQNSLRIDRLGYWGDDYNYGKDAVLDDLKNGTSSVSVVDTTDLYNKMVKGIDSFFSQLDLSNANYNFFFPPYSSLFWSEAQKYGYFDDYLDAKEYFIKKATESNAIVFDFQSAEITTNLGNYKDTTHFSPTINNWITKCFSQKDFIVTPENYAEYRNQLVNNTKDFKSEYYYLYE